MGRHLRVHAFDQDKRIFCEGLARGTIRSFPGLLALRLWHAHDFRRPGHNSDSWIIFNIPSQPLADALVAYGGTTGLEVLL